MRVRHYDDMEGFDGRAVVYNPEEEKKYHSTIWKVLAVVFLITILTTIVLHVDDLKLYYKGNTIDGEYDQFRNVVAFKNEKGDWRYYSPVGGLPEGTKVATLYYVDDINVAKTLTTTSFWVYSYAASLVGSGFCLYKIYKIYRKHK